MPAVSRLKATARNRRSAMEANCKGERAGGGERRAGGPERLEGWKVEKMEGCDDAAGLSLPAFQPFNLPAFQPSRPGQSRLRAEINSPAPTANTATPAATLPGFSRAYSFAFPLFARKYWRAVSR